MGVINQGILGGFSGKVGPVVGGKWKDIDYMRGYVVPANPNTVGQQAVRSKFSQLVETARLLLPSILQPYWDPFLSKMSGFNSWISKNYALADSAGLIDETAIMASGTLEGTASFAATYNTATGVVLTDYDPTIHGNGDEADFVATIVYDTVGKNFYFDINNLGRGDEEDTVTIPAGLTAANVLAFMFLNRGTGTELIVSDSIGTVCTAA